MFKQRGTENMAVCMMKYRGTENMAACMMKYRAIENIANYRRAAALEMF